MSTKSPAQRRQPPIERYLLILETIAAANTSLTLTELTNLLQLPKPTVHRLVNVLEGAGALESGTGHQRSFSIGRRMWRILQLGQSLDTVRNYAQLVCDELTEKIRETSYIVKLGIDDVQTVTRSVPDQGYRLHVLPGKELPPHAAASAKAIIAYQDERIQEKILSKPLKKLTSHTTTDPNIVRQHLNEVKKQGFAVCDREIDEDIMAYATPVILPKAGVLYSIGVTAPSNRLNQQPATYWVEHLQQAAEKFALLISESKSSLLESTITD